MKTENYFSKHSAVVQLISEAELHHQNSLLFWHKILELEKTIASDFDYFPEGMVNGLIESVGCTASYYDMAIARLGQIQNKYQRSKKRMLSDDDPEYDDVEPDDCLSTPVKDRKIFEIDVGDMPYDKLVEAMSVIVEEISKARKTD